MIKKWRAVRSAYLFKSPYVALRGDTVELPNGKTVDGYTVWEVPDGAVVIAITKDGNVLLTRQYRHGTGEILLQLPGGSYVKGHEEPEEAAARELLEETGYKANSLIFLGEVSIYPSKMTKQVSIYLAKNVEYVGTTQFDITEDIEIVSYPITEIERLIVTAKITDAEAIAGIFLTLQYLKTGS
jgi:ADP-ribose pyrophosphatase